MLSNILTTEVRPPPGSRSPSLEMSNVSSRVLTLKG